MTTVSVDAKNIRPLLGSVVSAKDAGAAMTPGVSKLVYVADDGDVELCDANTAATVIGRQLGIIVAGGNADADGNVVVGERVTVLWLGRVYLGETANLDESKQYFASDTAGGIEDAPGSNARRLGAPESTTIFFFNPSVSTAGS